MTIKSRVSRLKTRIEGLQSQDRYWRLALDGAATTLPIDYLRRVAGGAAKRFPRWTFDDAFQAAVEAWLEQPDTTPERLRGSRVYWKVLKAGLLTFYSSEAEARADYRKKYRATPKGKAERSRQEAARQRRRRAEKRQKALDEAAKGASIQP